MYPVLAMTPLEFHQIALKFHSRTLRYIGVQIWKTLEEKKLEDVKPQDSSHDENPQVHPQDLGHVWTRLL